MTTARIESFVSDVDLAFEEIGAPEPVLDNRMARNEGALDVEAFIEDADRAAKAT
jgi:hypothetical protein